MSESVKIVTADFVKVNVTNSKTDAVVFERKFPKNLTILEFKVRNKKIKTLAENSRKMPKFG